MILPATDETILRAIAALTAGELVGIPTETVYGLAANAWEPLAVAKIFAAKSRPATNPLIVHVANMDRLRDAIQWPPSPLIRKQLDSLADLWPGPLSVVCPRSSQISDTVTAGRATVAVRIPAHEVALRLLSACPFPLAAPSANRSCYISPTLPRHVCDASGLGEHVSMVIDGGPCLHGVESTIVLLGPRPQLLRPGSITRETLIERLGDSLASGPQHPSEQHPGEREPAGAPHDKASGETWLAPGMMREHYAPSTPLVLLADDRTPDLPMASARQGRAGGAGRIAFRALLPEETAGYRIVETLSQRGDLTEIARQLFAALRRLDNAGLSVIHCDTCEAVGLGLAIMDRLVRAAARTSDNTAKAHNGDSTESD